MKYVTPLIVLMLCVSAGLVAATKDQPVIKTGLQSLPDPLPAIGRKQSGVKYDFILKNEKFYIHVPPSCEIKKPEDKKAAAKEEAPPGIIVFMTPYNAYPELPKGWAEVLEEQKLIYVVGQGISEKQPTDRRMGLATVAALKLKEIFEADENRIFLAGFDGGARVACMTSYYHSDVFSGVIAICGASFHAEVPPKNVTRRGAYPHFEVSSSLAKAAKSKVKFALVTGSGSYRHGNVLDFYEAGFQKHNFQARLFNVPGLAHKVCSGKVFAEALAFIDPGPDSSAGSSPKKAASASTGPRTWTLSGGNRLEATLIKYVGNYVYLRKTDGKELALRVFDFSKADQAYLKTTRSAK